MARQIRMYLLVLFCLFIQVNFAYEKCVVCKRIVKGPKSNRSDSLYRCDFLQCFGISDFPDGKICGRCRKSVSEFRRTGKTFFHLARDNAQRRGRPAKKERDFPLVKCAKGTCKEESMKSTATQTDAQVSNDSHGFPGLLDLTNWKVEETCFGDLLRGPGGDTLLPVGLLEEIADNIKELAKRCDVEREIRILKERLYEEFVVQKRPPIYDPTRFESFCHEAGANNIFATIFKAMTEPRHSQERQITNRKRTVAVIYKLCYGLSQVCNWLQTDHGIFLKESNLNQKGLEAEREMGNSCCRRKITSLYAELAESNRNMVDDLISEAIKHQWQIVLIVDDYTSIHTKRRPKTEQLCQPKSMCTIVIKIFKNVKPIQKCNPATYHSIDGIDISSCTQTVCSPNSMYKLTFTYATVMPQWISNTFFNPELERHRLALHEYCENDSVRTMRHMADVHLVEFFELTLKSRNDFAAAFDAILNTKLADYLKKFLIFQPGDWPAQFYSRQIVYETLKKYCNTTNIEQSIISTPSDHAYAMPFTSGYPQESQVVGNDSSKDQPAILSVVPCIGPLHISLNGRETVFKDFLGFFEIIHNQLFPKSKLPKSPRPWRVSLILELVYGGWLIIRGPVKEKFKFSKDVEYMTLLNLLDNYIPLVLTIYSTTFKLNNFFEYFNAMIRIWTMFLCLERHHYDKAPLVWLAMCTYWGIHNPDLFAKLRLFLIMFDEYPVENAHSIIRSKTNDSDTAEQLRQKAKASFQAKAAQHEFKSYFSPPTYFTFSQNQLSYLKAKCADLIASIFIKIGQNPGKAEFKGNGRNRRVVLPRIFGTSPVKTKVLPLGYCSDRKPDPKKICDMPSCTVMDDTTCKWMLFEGCSHSFHLSCLSEIPYCPLCQKFLQDKATTLATTAKNAILNPNERKSDTNKESELNKPQSEVYSHNSIEDPCIGKCDSTKNVEGNIAAIISRISALTVPAPPFQQTRQQQHQQQHQQQQESQLTRTAVKPNHCKQCGHPVKGHKRPKGEKTKCEQCPRGICCNNPSGRCNCEWHLSRAKEQEGHSQQQQETQVPVHQAACMSLQARSHGSVTEWLLPPQICQSMIFGSPLGSNACTIIAAVGAGKFLSDNLNVPSNEDIIMSVSSFANNMKEGNIIYSQLTLPPGQPNLDVKEALATRSDHFNLKIKEDLGLVSSGCLEEKLREICEVPQKMCAILIVPPDKTMLLCFDSIRKTIALFESHKHGKNGGIIAVGIYTDISGFVHYLENMLACEWHTGIPGANMAILAKDI